MAGATTTFDDEAINIREVDHVDNLSKLAVHMPSLHCAFSNFVRPGSVEGMNGAPKGISPLPHSLLDALAPKRLQRNTQHEE